MRRPFTRRQIRYAVTVTTGISIPLDDLQRWTENDRAGFLVLMLADDQLVVTWLQSHDQWPPKLIRRHALSGTADFTTFVDEIRGLAPTLDAIVIAPHESVTVAKLVEFIDASIDVGLRERMLSDPASVEPLTAMIGNAGSH